MGILSFIVMAMMTHGQAQQVSEILCVGNCQAFMDIAKSHSTFMGDVCAPDANWPKDVSINDHDDPQHTYWATCGRKNCEDAGGEWRGANAWGECTQKRGLKQAPLDDKDPCTAGGCDGDTQEGPVGDMASWNQAPKLMDVPAIHHPPYQVDDWRKCSATDSIGMTMDMKHDMCFPNPEWDCEDRHNFAPLTSVDGQVHVCHRILK